MIAEEDYKQLQASGRSTELIQRQYEFLTGGQSLISEIRPAQPGEGILCLDEKQVQQNLDDFDNRADRKRWMKFVPASGAASRMFAPLYAFLEAAKQTDLNTSEVEETSEAVLMNQLKKELKKLPFFGSIYAKLNEDEKAQLETQEAYFINFIQKIVSQFENYPKGLIPFFNDEKGQEWTPFEAQLIESIELGKQKSTVPLHLTIDKNHRELFDKTFQSFQEKFGFQGQNPLLVEYSHQHRLTDTPFIDEKKQWVRDDKGAIAFRKGGHGALLENLNQLDADCIWIKNIDNILLGQSNAAGEKWMKILAGKLLTIQEALFEHLDTLEQQKSNTDFRRITDFIQTHFDPDFNLKSESKMSHEVLFDYLHRPLRVCGMIPNKGAVGGGPFWKKELRGQSLQIIEGVELDSTLKEHSEAIAGSTHFNPVMMVCGITDHRGEKFSLYDFRDEKRFMVSKKTTKDQPITILEWPGLWNGGMAEWNSIFIELPPETFNPVKSVMDLLR